MRKTEELEKIPDIYYKALNYVFEKNIVHQDGLWLEFGVYAGGTINRIARCASPNKLVYGFDSFEGLPEKWTGRIEVWDKSGRDSSYGVGTFSLGGILPNVLENVCLIKGWYKDSLPKFLTDHQGPVSFIHIDSDIYCSAKDILDNLAIRISNGCIIVFDELIDYPGFENHEWKAWWEFVEANNIKFEWIGGNKSRVLHPIENGGPIFDRGRPVEENVSPSHENVAVRIIVNPSCTA